MQQRDIVVKLCIH